MKTAAGTSRPAPGIRHPLPTRRWPTHFAAYGFVDESVEHVFGHLMNLSTGQTYPGVEIHPPSSDTGFWVISFGLPDNFPVGSNLYLLAVFNADSIQDGPILTIVSNLLFFPKGKPGYGNVVVDYPQNDDQVGSEFAASGTAPNSTGVTGKFGGCTGTITQGAPGPNWILYCQDNGALGSHCTLTVSQQNAGDGTGTFTIGPA
ncbi:MAG TPA: hypothetical protein VE999_04390 [Gemmataceae bacterium]|nr:hypothetical protein [Gemmataceae bacterium]